MTVQLLISTMHQSDHSLLDRMNVDSDAVVINQCNREGRENFDYNGHKILWIDTTERGLSKSRNMAIRNATADICLLSDDDMEYRSGYVNTVTTAFSRINADIMRFQVCGIEKKFKDYPADEQKIGYLKTMKMSSVEISFKRESFAKKNILFDELVGAGTEFLMGEESAMLVSCLKKGLDIFYVPEVIADLHIGTSTWFSGYNEKYFIGRGAAFTAMKLTFPSLLIWQWAIRKRSLYKDDFSILSAVKLMKKGKRLYLKKTKQSCKKGS